MSVSLVADHDFCREMLPKVSRTFAATIGLLPQPTLHRVLIAYELCRIADTVEDSPVLPAARKRELLAAFRDCLDEGAEGCPPGLVEAFAHPRNADELLTREAIRTLREFRAFPLAVRAAIRPWVREMCDGMADFCDLQPQPGTFRALDRVDDLDTYCYYVAGTVGHLLTALFHVHSPRLRGDRFRRLDGWSAEFGRGLQMVNIIKDVADDRTRGWSYVPHELCEPCGLSPADLTDPLHAGPAREAMRRMIDKALHHLGRGFEYCLSVPAFDYRIRLFCLSPLFFAVRTLVAAAHDPRLLDPTHKVKISRQTVYRTLLACHLFAPSDTLLRWYYRRISTI